MSENTETAILAGGCFWGVQELLRQRDGVISTRVGYTGGENDNPTYRNHPGHAEAVEIVFDPERISYRDILEFFFQIHDPTTKDRQGNDIGSDYRSEIFSASDEQRRPPPYAHYAGPCSRTSGLSPSPACCLVPTSQSPCSSARRSATRSGCSPQPCSRAPRLLPQRPAAQAVPLNRNRRWRYRDDPSPCSSAQPRE
jgi:hypothetical protein